ncbi:hypothetical protein [uncultured Winogradskyella sp.]|uniref:hypothetical protein n=1 Tax=uncultured Winogradskyella sp. TaxID=395353 RepID=UPI002605AA02|nr:hypothetical protein [uncultured Winogradskyella sp.]
MNEKKNIDRLFQEKFKDFEAVPNDAVWNRISESLPKKKKKRRVIALWWQIGGVAAVIALLLTVGVSVFNSDTNNSTEKPVIVDTEDATNNSKIDTPSNDKQNQLNDSSEFEEIELVESDKSEESIQNSKNNGSNNNQQNNASLKLTIPNNPNSNNSVANNSEEKEKTTQPQNRKSLIIRENNNTKVAENTKAQKRNTKTELSNKDEIKSVIKETIESNKTAVTDNTTKETDNSNIDNTDINTVNDDNEKDVTAALEDPKKQSIKDAVATQENINEKEKEDEQSRWSIAPNVAPVYFSSLGQGSSIDRQFNQNSKSSDINMSYGISGTYAVSDKLKVRAGINRVNLSQTTSDVYTFTGGEFASRGDEVQIGNINPRNGLGNITIMSVNVFNRSSSPEVFNTKIAGNLDQRFGFIEVPLELEYRLVDKKFGLNVIGGFSTFFLNQNEIYVDIDGTSTLIGEASNINSTSFSANFGLGLDYKLSKQWNINLEPQFKYQINTFNNTSGDFRPFFIGVYTGLSFKF